MPIKSNDIFLELVNVDEILNEVADTIKKDIKQKAPSRTSEYANGIVVVDYGDNIRKIGNKGTKGSISHILEFGSKYSRPQPHYRLGFEQNKDLLEETIKKKLEIKGMEKE